MGKVTIYSNVNFTILMHDCNEKRFNKHILTLDTVLKDHEIYVRSNNINKHDDYYGNKTHERWYCYYSCKSDRTKFKEFVKFIEDKTDLTIAIEIKGESL